MIICKIFTVVVISNIRTRTGFDPMAICARASHRNQGFNLLNAELNPICHLLALVEAHPILHVSRVRVKIIVCHCWIIVLCYLN